MSSQPFSAVTLARVLRPHGLRGEVAADILTDFPQRMSTLRQVWLRDASGVVKPVALLSCRIHNGQAIFHFESYHSIDEAELLRGCEVQIPLSDRVSLAAGQYFVTDLIGCDVYESGAATPLGRVRDIQPIGEGVAGTPLLVVETPASPGGPAGELLVPFAAEICSAIDLAARRIVVSLPEGLRELA
ncbi:MAG TPA: ribosome maturation factor RimM [Methylomirabilota bacterium]|nr:ribosome maturation factor RimM [Methylomirabilota bacterium]